MEDRLKELLKKAINENASDIHFSLNGNNIFKIEMRINQNLKKVKTKKNDFKLIRYLQYLANLDVANQIKPATGQFDMEVNNNTLSLRFAYMKSFHTTTGVLRILNHKLKLTIDNLSKFESQNQYFKELIKLKYGLILISGTTGSGKTTTLYTMLNSIRNKKIYTIEDPIEIYSEKYVQLQVNKSIGLDYQACLRQLLRHDPDLIVIGEIRDDITANIAIKAAISGHLVFATIHSSSTITTILRMLEFNVSKTLLEDMLISIINQDLYKYNKQRVPIYEIMEKKDIRYYITNNKLPRYFHKKNYYFNKAIKSKYIEEIQ
jgi:competence protein ComGA